MKSNASVLYALRMLFPRTGKKSNARRSLIGAFMCIAISLIPLVMVLTVSNGMIVGMTSRMIGLSSSHLCCVIHPDMKQASSVDNLLSVAKQFGKVDGVLKHYTEIQSIGLAAGTKGRTGASIRAVENDIFKKNQAFSELFTIVESSEEIKRPSDIYLSEGKNAVIGKKIAEDLGLHAGDDIRLITTKYTLTGKILPKITKFKISAIVSSGYQELDALWVFIPLRTGFSILPVRASQILIGLETEDPFSWKLDRVRKDLELIAPQYTRIYKWNELNASQYENFTSTQIMLLFIMLLIVLVASVNISSALVMLVMERRKEIAILKSLGATPSGITFSFLITGMVTGCLGVLAGIPAGLLAAVNFDSILSLIEKVITYAVKIIYILRGMDASEVAQLHILDPAFYLQNIPLSIPLKQLVIISAGTLVLSLFVSAVPAIKAGLEKPIESLRKL